MIIQEACNAIAVQDPYVELLAYCIVMQDVPPVLQCPEVYEVHCLAGVPPLAFWYIHYDLVDRDSKMARIFHDIAMLPDRARNLDTWQVGTEEQFKAFTEEAYYAFV